MSVEQNAESGTKIRNELRDHTVDYMPAYLFEGFNYSSFLHDGSLRERYLYGKAEIHLHFLAGLRGATRQPGHYCAVFNRATGIEFRSFNEVVGATNTGLSGGDKRQVNEAVLVDVRKLAEYPQRVSCIVVPSFVRLQTVDDCLRLWVDPSNSLIPFLGVGSTDADNWKGRVTFTIRGGALSVSQEEIISEVVQGGSKVMQTVSDDESELNRGLGENFDSHDVLTPLMVKFIGEAIWVRFKPPSKLDVQELDVFTRPLQP